MDSFVMESFLSASKVKRRQNLITSGVHGDTYAYQIVNFWSVVFQCFVQTKWHTDTGTETAKNSEFISAVGMQVLRKLITDGMQVIAVKIRVRNTPVFPKTLHLLLLLSCVCIANANCVNSYRRVSLVDATLFASANGYYLCRTMRLSCTFCIFI